MNAENVIKKRIKDLEGKRQGHEEILISKTRIGGDVSKTLVELDAIGLRLDEASNLLEGVKKGKG